jgi:hypothetical protein
MQIITERITQPSPDEIRAARERARLNQTQAAGLVSPATAAGYKTWSGYEQPVGTRNHRAIPLAAIRRLKLQGRYLNGSCPPENPDAR